MNGRTFNLLQGISLALVIIGADRLTKWWALTQECKWQYGICSVRVSPVLNRGISWGVFHSESSLAFTVVTSFVVAVFLLLFIHAIYTYSLGQTIIPHALIIGGALSNIIDRITHCGVVDFISLSLGNICTPIFNVADTAIVVGVVYLLYESVWSSEL